jgi:hypothetical protein
MNEAPDDFYDMFLGKLDTRLIRLKIKAVQLTYVYNCGDFVYCLVAIILLNNNIGTYKMVFTLNGEAEDDTLNFEDTNYIKNVVGIIKKTIEVAKKAINEGLKSEIVSRITGLDLDYVNKLEYK